VAPHIKRKDTTEYVTYVDCSVFITEAEPKKGELAPKNFRISDGRFSNRLLTKISATIRFTPNIADAKPYDKTTEFLLDLNMKKTVCK
jgi:hypothetical protein